MNVVNHKQKPVLRPVTLVGRRDEKPTRPLVQIRAPGTGRRFLQRPTKPKPAATILHPDTWTL